MLDTLLEKNKVKVLAGSVPSGDYQFSNGFLLQDGRIVLDFRTERDSIRKEGEESAKNWLVAGGITVGLSIFFGPFGLLGLLLGNQKNVAFSVKVDESEPGKGDGMSFLAVTEHNTYIQILANSREYQ